MTKVFRGRITEISVSGSYRGPMYFRVTSGTGPGRMILLNSSYQMHGLTVGDFVEVEVQEGTVLGLTARNIRKVDPPPQS